jgi:hypothetical protein
MLEPHATEIRQELVAVRVAALHHAARPSHAGPLRRAVGNAFVRLGLLLGSDGSVPPSVTQPASSGALADARASEPIWLGSRHTAFASELDLAWETAAPYGIRVGAPLTERR